MKKHIITALIAAATAHAGHPLDIWTGTGSDIGGVVFPQLNYQNVVGTSTGDVPSLQLGRNDPHRDGFTHQLFEASLGVRLGEHGRLFGSYESTVRPGGNWDDRFSEYYAEFGGLPLGLVVKGGRFQTVFGTQNTLHSHQFTMVDKDLPFARIVGPAALALHGGEVSLPVFARTGQWSDRLTLAGGQVVDSEAAQGQAGARFDARRAAFSDTVGAVDYRLTFERSPLERFSGGVSAAFGNNEFGRSTEIYGAHFEYLRRSGTTAISAADGKTTRDGKEIIAPTRATVAGPTFFRWRTDVVLREIGAEAEGVTTVSERTIPGTPDEPPSTVNRRVQVGITKIIGTDGNDVDVPIFATRKTVTPGKKGTPPRTVRKVSRTPDLRDNLSEIAVVSTLTYGFADGKTQAHLRGEYVGGIGEAGLSERWRISPAISYHPLENIPLDLKLQYNYDHVSGAGEEHSVWLQLGYQWGGGAMAAR